MTTENRRQILRTVARIAVATTLGAVMLTLGLRRRSSRTGYCHRAGRCHGCSITAGCPVHQALSTRSGR